MITCHGDQSYKNDVNNNCHQRKYTPFGGNFKYTILFDAYKIFCQMRKDVKKGGCKTCATQIWHAKRSESFMSVETEKMFIWFSLYSAKML